MRRVLVGGISGSGKTTLAKIIAERTALPFTEMDALFHGPNWQPRPSFVADVSAITDEDRWVFDSHGYPDVREMVWARADTFVWLDYSLSVVMRRVIARSARRAIDRQPIFNDNVETFRAWMDPEHPIRWAWSQHANRRTDLRARVADPANSHVRVHHFTRPGQTLAWVATLHPERAAGG